MIRVLCLKQRKPGRVIAGQVRLLDVPRVGDARGDGQGPLAGRDRVANVVGDQVRERKDRALEVEPRARRVEDAAARELVHVGLRDGRSGEAPDLDGVLDRLLDDLEQLLQRLLFLLQRLSRRSQAQRDDRPLVELPRLHVLERHDEPSSTRRIGMDRRGNDRGSPDPVPVPLDFRAADVARGVLRARLGLEVGVVLEILVGPGELAVEVDVLVAQPEGVGDLVRGGAATVVGDLVRRVLQVEKPLRVPSFLTAMVVPSAPRLIAMYP